MRPAPRMRLLLAFGAIAALAIAACSSNSPAGWTFAPVPSVTPPPATAAPTTGPSAAPSTPASPGPSGSGATGDTVRLAAQNVAFDTDALQAPAGQAFAIEFDNRDAGIPHNVAIHDPANQALFTGEIFNGPGARTYQVPALTAGAYTFVCTVHPNMTGTLTVE